MSSALQLDNYPIFVGCKRGYRDLRNDVAGETMYIFYTYCNLFKK